MRDALLHKALTDLRGQVLAWGVGMGALLLFTVSFYPSISSSYAEMIEQLPEGFMAFFGGAGLDTFEGYINAEFFSYGPLVLAVFAVLAGTAALAGEEGDGTLEVLLASPITRTRLAVAKLIALTAALGAVLLIMFAFTWATLLFIDTDASLGRLTAAFALLWPFEVAAAFAAALLSLVVGGRLLAGTAIAVILIASYIIQGVSGLVSWLQRLAPAFPTSYYQGDDALVDSISWPYVIALIAAVFVLAGLILWVFQRRDIGVRGVKSMSGVWPWSKGDRETQAPVQGAAST